MPRSALLILFWLAVALCAFAQLALLRDVIAGKTPGASPFRASHWAEIAWAALPAVVLAGILIITWRVIDAGQLASLGAPFPG